MPSYDVAVIGGGIVGLATAMACLTRWPGCRLIVVEKELDVGRHQTAHNSGVIHSGVYYRPGSLKAQTCIAGANLLIEFCRQHGIAHERCGKLIVATRAEEVPRLTTLYERGVANGVAGLSLVGPERIRELEPCARGVQALHVPSAGIVDYRTVAQAMARVIERAGGTIQTTSRVRRLAREGHEWIVRTSSSDLRAAFLIACPGLHADRVARLAGADQHVRIIPFRGEYYHVVPSRRYLVRSMVYPVPDPSLPFLGVHLTRSIDGELHAGPNAVLALKREGYRKRDVSLADIGALVTFPGFWHMAAGQWSIGVHEAYRSWSRRAFVRAVQRLVPEIRSEDLTPGGSGVRAQAVDLQGRLLDDFDIAPGQQAIYVRNVPSPAATASIRIGQLIAGMAAEAGACAPATAVPVWAPGG